MIDLLILLVVFSLLNSTSSQSRICDFLSRCLEHLATRVCLLLLKKETAGTSHVDSLSEDDSVSLEDDSTLESSDESFNTPVRTPPKSNISSSPSSSLSSYERRTRRVRFSSVCVRNYNVLPMSVTSSQPPILAGIAQTSRFTLTLDWSYGKERELPVELFERMRSFSYQRKSHTRRKISSGKPISVSPKQQMLHMQSRNVSKSKHSGSQRPESVFHKFDELLMS